MPFQHHFSQFVERSIVLISDFFCLCQYFAASKSFQFKITTSIISDVVTKRHIVAGSSILFLANNVLSGKKTVRHHFQ